MPLVTTPCPLLNSYVETVDRIADEDLSPAECVEKVTRANEELLASGFVLPELLRCLQDGAPYTRNLVHQDPANRYAIIALLWGPWQETRIHDHLNWGVVSVLEGKVMEINYDVEELPEKDRVRLCANSATLYEPGAIRGITPPPRSNVHRMANPSWRQAISLHTYGDPGTKSRVFDERSGAVDILDLVFHNQGGESA